MSTSTVTYNGVGHAATYVSAAQLTIALSTSDQSTAGSYAVVVTNPTPGGGASNSVNFTVNSSNPVPVVSSLSPSSLTAGASAQTLTINGSNFVSGSTVTYNGVGHAATFASAGQTTIQLTAGDLATAGSYPVVVTNPGPGGGASNSVNFTVNAAAPSVSVTIPSGNYQSSMTVGASQSITAVVTGATANLSWSVSGSNGGSITGTGTTVTYNAPTAIPGGNNPVTITATQSGSSASASVEVTINRSTTARNVINVPGSQEYAAGVNLSIPNSTPTLGLASVGTCSGSPAIPGTCTATVTGMQAAQGANVTVWLIGQGLTNSPGSSLASGLAVSVSQGSSSDVTVSSLTPQCNSTGNASCPNNASIPNVTLGISVSASATVGVRNIVVTNGSGELAVYVGAIQIVP
jgi:hypothetical protein